MASTQANQTTRPAKIGLMLPHMEKPDGQRSWADIRDMAELAEDIGFDSVWVVDHYSLSVQAREQESHHRGHGIGSQAAAPQVGLAYKQVYAVRSFTGFQAVARPIGLGAGSQMRASNHCKLLS